MHRTDLELADGRTTPEPLIHAAAPIKGVRHPVSIGAVKGAAASGRPSIMTRFVETAQTRFGEAYIHCIIPSRWPESTNKLPKFHILALSLLGFHGPHP